MKSVHAGKLRQVSASQITKYDPTQVGGCPRRWYFDKVQGIPEPTTPSLTKGSSIHSEIEHYLLTGENILSPVALAGFEFMPRGDGLLVEHDLQDKTIADVPLVGRVDLINGSDAWIDEQGTQQEQDLDTIEIVDWKTTSNLSYAKSGQDLFNTVQMPLYGYYVGKDHDAENVRLSHVYFQTKGRARATKSTALFSLDEIEQRYHAIERVVHEMTEAARETDVSRLDANTRSCSAFGRECPYASICPRTTAEVFDARFGKGEKDMGLFDRLDAKKKLTTTNGASEHSTSAIIAQANAQEQVNEELRKLQEEERALRAFGVQTIVPPDARPSEGPGTFEPEPPQAQGLFARKVFSQPTKPAEPAPATLDTTPAVAAPAGADDVYACKTCKQVKKIPDFAKHCYECRDVRKQNSEALVEAAAPSASSLELYVDCVVRGVETQDLHVMISRACKEIQEKYNTPDIRIGKEPLAFGGWKAVLAAVLRGYDLDGRWSVTTSGDITAAAVEALEQQASLVVRGAR